MEKNITLESIRNKSYEEMSREEKQFFCENAHLFSEDTQEDSGIIIVDDIDSYIRQRNLITISESEIERISQLSESMMMQESQSWRPSQWAAYLSKGRTFDDKELDRYIEEELIER